MFGLEGLSGGTKWGVPFLNHDLRPTEHPIVCLGCWWTVINSLGRIFHFKGVLQIEVFDC